MAAELLAMLVEGLAASSMAILLVLALRAPWRRAFGAALLPLLWLLVPAALLAMALPAPVERIVEAPAQLAAVGGAAVATASVEATIARDASMPLLALWLLGSLACAAHFIGQQRRFRRLLGPLRERADGHCAASSSVVGPAVLGLLRPRIVLPADFEQRFDAEQQALILAHEHSHLRRGDLVASAIATALRCVYWFNPLVHLGAARLRQDHELAADAEVLQRHPHARRRYADTLLNVQLAVPGLPVGCLWQSSHPLKERILMLKQPAVPRFNPLTGAVVGIALAVGISALAWAGQPARPAAASEPDAATARADGNVDPVSYRRIARPKYPQAAVDAGQSGKVLLEVLVGVDGSPLEIQVAEASAPGVFDEAAIASVRNWQFNPAVKDGKAVESRVLVPICYATEETSNDCPGPDAVDALDGIYTRPREPEARSG